MGDRVRMNPPHPEKYVRVKGGSPHGLRGSGGFTTFFKRHCAAVETAGYGLHAGGKRTKQLKIRFLPSENWQKHDEYSMIQGKDTCTINQD